MDTVNPIIAAKDEPPYEEIHIESIDPAFAVELIDLYRIDVSFTPESRCTVVNYSEGCELSASGRGLVEAVRNWAHCFNNLQKSY